MLPSAAVLVSHVPLARERVGQLPADEARRVQIPAWKPESSAEKRANQVVAAEHEHTARLQDARNFPHTAGSTRLGVQAIDAVVAEKRGIEGALGQLQPACVHQPKVNAGVA